MLLVPGLLSSWVAAIAVFGANVYGCGPAVHNEAAERARQWFYAPASTDNTRITYYRGILDRHLSSMQAGTVFPDWGYGCMSMDDEAEAAHWTPFLEHALAYFHQTYARPYSAQAEQLAAFLFGVAAHQVSDEQWHSLSGLHDGFMRVLADSAFNGEYSRAHDVLDVGGDFAMAHMSDLAYIGNTWLVPVDDVLAIYARMGFSVSRWRMNMCIKRQFYAMEAVKRFGRGMFPSYAARAPMLTERLNDYYIGGLYAMATGTSSCWHALIDWFDSGNYTNKCMVSDRVSQPRSPDRRTMQGKSRLQMMDLPKSWIRQIRESVSMAKSNGQLHLHANPLPLPKPAAAEPPQSSNGRQHAFTVQQPDAPDPLELSANNAAGDCASLSTVFPKIKQMYTTSAYSGFGTSVVSGDFSGSGAPSVAISAPYFQPGQYDTRHSGNTSAAGAVFIIDEVDPAYTFSQQDVLDAEPLVLRPYLESAAYKPRFPLFGSSMAVIDFNADGIDDLAVGSSGYGRHPDGAMLGRVDIYLGRRGVGLPQTPDFTLTAEQLAIHINARRSQQRIGGFLFGEDVNGDGFKDLVIGAPYNSRLERGRHSGQVFGYMARASRPMDGIIGRPDFVVESPAHRAFEWFGFTARAVRLPDSNTTTLLVGAPGHSYKDDTGKMRTLVGRIYGFSVSPSAGGEPEFYGLEFATEKENTQLGSQIYVWNNQSSSMLVLFGSPSEHNSGLGQYGPTLPDKPAPERGWQAGEVRIVDPMQWTQPAIALEGNPDEMAGLLNTLRGVQSPGHFGRALAATARELWIGEPFSDMEDGRIYRWRAGSKRPSCFIISNMSQSRFGHSIKAIPGKAGDLVLVTAPHDSQFTRFSGTVALMT